ncbi:MAG: DUF1631 family protein [Gammaproteobacteria bacterium]|nr:DUF1631 family protein [Gammaproteobacteria bacterium]
MMGAERRSEARLQVMLDAILHPESGRTWPCSIHDFCVGGMLLMGEEGSRRTLRSAGFDPQLDDVVHIHFSVPELAGARNFRVTGQVARVLDNGLGVYFPDGMALRAFRALEGYAGSRDFTRKKRTVDGDNKAWDNRPKLSEEDAAVARKLVHDLSHQALGQFLKATFDRVLEDLLIQARDASNNVRQNLMFGGMTLLEKGQMQITEQVVASVIEQINQPVDMDQLYQRRQSRGKQGESRLSLVDTEQFEDWLLVADVISRAETRYSEDLMELSLRLAMVAPAWGEKDALPVGPTVLSVAFDDAVKPLELEREIRQILFGCFRDVLIAFLRRFYPALRKTLEESGLFPSTEEIISAANKQARESENEAEVDDEPEDKPEDDDVADGGQPRRRRGRGGAPRGRAGGGQPRSGGPATGNHFGEFGTRQARPEPQAGAFTQQFAVPAAALAAARAEYEAQGQDGGQRGGQRVRGGGRGAAPIGNVYGAARELMHLQRALPGPDGLPTEAPWSDEVHAAPDTVYREDELMAAFDRLTSQPPPAPGEPRVPIRRRLARELAQSGGNRTFSPQQRDALEVVDGLLESVRGDGYLPPTFGNWLDKLEVTYSKLATEDTEFLDTSKAPMHAALRFLDGLAELGTLTDAGDGMDPAIQAQVDKLLFQLERDYDGGPAVFEHGLEEIEPLLQRQRRLFEGNLQRVARQSEGSHRLVRARRAVVRELGTKLSGRDVPELILKLLNPGWRNLLVHTQLRHGSDSAEWRGQVDVVDRLTTALSQGQVAPLEAEELVAEVAAGLESIAFEPGKRQPLLDALIKALSGQGDAGPTVTVEDDDSTAELLGLENQLPETAPEPDGIKTEAQRKQWERWVERAKELEVGSWLSELEDAGRSRILTVAWIGEDHGTFTLINRKGVKVHDYELRDLVSGLNDGRLTILDEADQPLTERASQRMLQNMHNQLAYQATHDALTGLMNRKEYERRVEQAVIQAETSDVEHAVLFFDLDQFKIINNTSGHDAGDELLRALVPRLRHELRGTRSVLARLGGDEFGVLLERCKKEEALQLAQGLRKSIADFRFEWGEREYAITASMGFVAFRNDGREAATLLQQADQACYAAKDGGRNRMQIFEVGDKDLAARRGVMEWVSEVDRVLKQDRIRLTAQRIAPIGRAEAPSHYEVLMTVLDEKGKPMPPIDFITAAETYDRMPAVDRWIVSHTLDWMSQHVEWLDEVHGFSINLSGASLNDEGFLDYVIAELERTKVPTDKVTFEITETTAITSMDGARRFMRRLNDLGCTFSLDDFGTGLASYSYLRNLEVDFVKIDGVFVKDLVTNPADFAVVKSVNEIAHFMGKQTIAECVENEEILERLREIGVDYAQGWGIERPKALVDFFR